jgi:hypothetical protein
MTHYSDCMAVLDWLDSAAIPEQVRSAIVRCLGELERYDRGLCRNYAQGDWPELEERRPITEAVQKALRGADPFDEIPEPINGLCPLCQRDVPGILLSGKFLPMRGPAHAATCPNAAGFFRRRADKLLAEADAMAHDPNFSWTEHGEKFDRTLAEYRAASDAWLAAVLEERGRR